MDGIGGMQRLKIINESLKWNVNDEEGCEEGSKEGIYYQNLHDRNYE